MALNILIVDDSQTVRSIIIKTLEISGIPVNQIHQASNGEEALCILKDNWIDLVFSDINMPVMDGIEMVDKMGKDGILKSVPVVIVSTEGSKTRIEQLKEKGISAYIRKPFTPEQIREIVDKIMGVQNE
jgi:two-component system, chemotaxis family, chemotaxis protein CheY